MSAKSWIACATKLALITTLACGRVGFDAHSDSGVAMTSLYAYRKPITLSNPQPVTELPVSIVVVDGELAQHADPAGSDLAFFDAALQPLAHEVVAYDSSTGALECWVRVPTLAAGTTDIFLYYGGPTSTVDPGAVWKSFAGVWHMNGTGGIELDHTVNTNDVTAAGTAQPEVTSGIVGNARLYDGVDDSLAAPDHPSLDFGTGSFGVAIWVNVTSTIGVYDTPIHKGGSSAGTPGYDMELGSGEWNPCIGDGTEFLCSPGFGSAVSFVGTGWVSLVVQVDRSTNQMQSYANGMLTDTSDSSTIDSVDNTRGLDIGRDSFPFKGAIDEVMIWPGTVSAAWIGAMHRNLANRTAFVTVGAEEAR